MYAHTCTRTHLIHTGTHIIHMHVHPCVCVCVCTQPHPYTYLTHTLLCYRIIDSLRESKAGVKRTPSPHPPPRPTGRPYRCAIVGLHARVCICVCVFGIRGGGWLRMCVCIRGALCVNIYVCVFLCVYMRGGVCVSMGKCVCGEIYVCV